MTKTPGFQQFEHLTDKSSLFLFMLDKEAETLSELRASAAELRREKTSIQESNRDLSSRIDALLAKRAEMDQKAGDLLKVLDDIPLS
jgi:chromosome segregation ATPase